MIRPSEKIRTILSDYFPQESNFETSVLPINTDFSVPFAEIDKQRIIIYQTSGRASLNCLENKKKIRNFTFDIVVAHPNNDDAFAISNMVYNILTKYKDSEYVSIYPVDDISPLGKNAKKLWLYSCTYNIEYSK